MSMYRIGLVAEAEFAGGMSIDRINNDAPFLMLGKTGIATLFPCKVTSLEVMPDSWTLEQDEWTSS